MNTYRTASQVMPLTGDIIRVVHEVSLRPASPTDIARNPRANRQASDTQRLMTDAEGNFYLADPRHSAPLLPGGVDLTPLLLAVAHLAMTVESFRFSISEMGDNLRLSTVDFLVTDILSAWQALPERDRDEWERRARRDRRGD